MNTIPAEALFLYAENARSKIKDLSSVLKKTPQRLKYTLRQFEKEYVHNPHCIFDYSYFGLILFRVYFKGGYISESDRENILRQLKENYYIVAIYELSGEFDLAIEIESPNPSRFNKELKKVATLIPTLNNYKIVLNVVTHIYPRSYLLNNNQLMINMPPEIVIGGDRSVENFNENEMRIMKNLLFNPKLRLTSLAKEADLNVKTATSVMKSLRQRKIIRGFHYLLDTDKMDIYKFRLFLKLHNIGKERETTFLEFLLRTPEIVEANRTVGDWDVEVDIESLDKTKIRQLIVKVREDFKDLIENFNIIEFHQYYKKTYLPQYLFLENTPKYFHST